jgi:hypothetical protein
MVESGFSSGDLSIKVPYVNASVKADKEEKQQSELVSISKLFHLLRNRHTGNFGLH